MKDERTIENQADQEPPKSFFHIIGEDRALWETECDNIIDRIHNGLEESDPKALVRLFTELSDATTDAHIKEVLYYLSKACFNRAEAYNEALQAYINQSRRFAPTPEKEPTPRQSPFPLERLTAAATPPVRTTAPAEATAKPEVLSFNLCDYFQLVLNFFNADGDKICQSWVSHEEIDELYGTAVYFDIFGSAASSFSAMNLNIKLRRNAGDRNESITLAGNQVTQFTNQDGQPLVTIEYLGNQSPRLRINALDAGGKVIRELTVFE